MKKLIEQAELRDKEYQHVLLKKDVDIQILRTQLMHMHGGESSLKEQLALYQERFVDFDTTLSKSNETFAAFKADMDKLKGKLQAVEKENAALRKECDRFDVRVVELIYDKETLKAQINAMTSQRDKQKKLCNELLLKKKQANSTI
jgi:chromosome segregation ATPase